MALLTSSGLAAAPFTRLCGEMEGALDAGLEMLEVILEPGSEAPSSMADVRGGGKGISAVRGGGKGMSAGGGAASFAVGRGGEAPVAALGLSMVGGELNAGGGTAGTVVRGGMEGGGAGWNGAGIDSGCMFVSMFGCFGRGGW